MRNFGVTRSRLKSKRKLLCDLSELILCMQNTSKYLRRAYTSSNIEEQKFEIIVERKQLLGFLYRNFTVLAYNLDKDFIWVYIPRNKQFVAQKFIKNFIHDIRTYSVKVTEQSRELILMEPVTHACIDEVVCNITDFTSFMIMFRKKQL